MLSSYNRFRSIKSLRMAARRLLLPLSAGLLLAGSVQRAAAWGIVWSDEFTGVNNQPWSGNWSFQTGRGQNNEIQNYVSSWANCHVVSDGTGTDGQALRFRAETDNGNQYGNWYSARINSYGKHMVEPGSYVEARCKFPNSGKGYWPAAWMLGTVGGNWPANGEIDIAEEKNAQWECYQTLHMTNWHPGIVRTVNQSTTTYHNYGAWWPADGSHVTFNIDGQDTATFTRGGGGTWAFNTNNRLYIILNLAIGGDFPGNPDGSTQVNGHFFVDYVRHWR
jgi:hypothetical protein